MSVEIGSTEEWTFDVSSLNLLVPGTNLASINGDNSICGVINVRVDSDYAKAQFDQDASTLTLKVSPTSLSPPIGTHELPIEFYFEDYNLYTTRFETNIQVEVTCSQPGSD